MTNKHTLQIVEDTENNAKFIARGKSGAVYAVSSLGTYLDKKDVRVLWSRSNARKSLNVEAVVKIIHAPAFNSVSNQALVDAAMQHISIVSAQEAAGLRVVPDVFVLAVSKKPNKDGQNVYYLGMERVQGETLAEYAHKHNGLDDITMAKLKKLYRKLWSLGYVHGDAHRGNVMRLANGELILIDMDFARSASRATMTLLSKYGHNDDESFWKNTNIESAIARNTAGRNSNYAFLKRAHQPIPKRTAPIRFTLAPRSKT